MEVADEVEEEEAWAAVLPSISSLDVEQLAVLGPTIGISIRPEAVNRRPSCRSRRSGPLGRPPDYALPPD